MYLLTTKILSNLQGTKQRGDWSTSNTVIYFKNLEGLGFLMLNFIMKLEVQMEFYLWSCIQFNGIPDE